MTADLTNVSGSNAALLMMHFQVDVFAALSSVIPADMVSRANVLIGEWRKSGRPVIFADFMLGSRYEAVNTANRLVFEVSKTGLFRSALPAAGLDTRPGDMRYLCPRASIFYDTTLDDDLRSLGINTLVMAGIATTGVLFSSVGWASDADYRIFIVRSCCFDPDEAAHDALFRTSFATRAQIL